MTVIAIMPNPHVYHGPLLKPANDTFLEIMMRDEVKKRIKDMLNYRHFERGVVLDILRQELELAVVSYFGEDVPDDCA